MAKPGRLNNLQTTFFFLVTLNLHNYGGSPMRAAQITGYDGPDKVEVNDVNTPELGPDQVLVDVVAAGVNPFDVKVTQGYAKDWVDLQFPATLGGDVAGVV